MVHKASKQQTAVGVGSRLAVVSSMVDYRSRPAIVPDCGQVVRDQGNGVNNAILIEGL